MTTPRVCKKCGKEVGGSCIGITKDREFVVVDEQTQQATILNKGDHLCDVCSKTATFYRREK